MVGVGSVAAVIVALVGYQTFVANSDQSASSTPTPRPLTKAEEFVKEMERARDQLQVALEGMQTEAAISDLAVYADAALQLRVVTELEVVWIDDRPPDPCYRSAHGASRAAYAQLSEAAEALTSLAAAGDPAAIGSADEILAPGMANLETATSLTDAIPTACAG